MPTSRNYLLAGLVSLCVVGSACTPPQEEETPAGTGGRAPATGTGGSTPTGTGGTQAGTGGSPVVGTGGSPVAGTGGAPVNGTGGAAEDASSTPDSSTPQPGDGGAPPSSASGPSPACTAGAMVPGPDGYQTIMSGGRMRKFLIRVPKSYDGKKPLGLIFAFHGGGANGMSFEGRISSIRTAVGERAIYVYPDGLAMGGGMITWARDHKDDLALVDAILGWLKEKVCYDTSRVFAMGQSSGAYFSHTVGCHRAGVFRAVATNGGGVRDNEFVDCKNQPVAAWVSNGAADAPHLPPARKARDAWVKINGCTMANPTKVDPSPCVSFTGCKAGFPMHYCENPGGHDIPGYMPKGLSDFFFGNFDK